MVGAYYVLRIQYIKKYYIRILVRVGAYYVVGAYYHIAGKFGEH